MQSRTWVSKSALNASHFRKHVSAGRGQNEKAKQMTFQTCFLMAAGLRCVGQYWVQQCVYIEGGPPLCCLRAVASPSGLRAGCVSNEWVQVVFRCSGFLCFLYCFLLGAANAVFAFGAVSHLQIYMFAM